jgi:hypothetical protein
LRLEQPHSIRRVLVSAPFADSIQQIHSLRARGVMSSHVSNAFASEVSALFRSAGRSWTTPPEISFSLRASLISVSPECEMTEREGFEASNARALNGFLVLGSSFRSVSTRHSCTFYWVSLATKYPLMVPDTFWGLSSWVALVFADWPGQTRTASWLKADKSTHGRQVRL